MLHLFLPPLAAAGDRLLAFFAEEPSPGRFVIHAVAGGSSPGRFVHACLETSPHRFGTFTDVCPGVHWFDREIYDLFGLLPEGHPEGNPLRFHEASPKHFYPLRGGAAPPPEPRKGYRFLLVRGEGIHEVAVGPVHAGIIEPGHFRFSCAGETIQNLEIRLGYQHKGTESLLRGKPGMRQLLLSESISGDTAVAHANACARLLERALGKPAGRAAETWRSVALEIERLANHCGDLAGLATDIGYLFGASHFAQLRGTALNLLLRLTGSRFGRGLNRIGGTAPGVPGIGPEELRGELARLEAAVEETGRTMLDAPSVVSRMDGTGRLLRHTAETLQVVGVAGRASGRNVDARRDFPSPCFEDLPPEVVVAAEGDVMARANPVQRDARLVPLALRRALPPRRDAGLRRRGGRRSGRPPDPRGFRRGGVARENRPRGDHRTGRRHFPLQGRRSVVPQLAGALVRRPEERHLGLPSVQQELQPVVLGRRPLT